MMKKEPDKAIADLDEAIRLEPKQPGPMLNAAPPGY